MKLVWFIIQCQEKIIFVWLNLNACVQYMVELCRYILSTRKYQDRLNG